MDDKPDPVSVQCLYCGAKPGMPCQDFRGGTSHRTHAKRIKLAAMTVASPPLREQTYNSSGEHEEQNHG